MPVVRTGSTGGNRAAYGSIPVLPTTGQLTGSQMNILNSAIPNFSGLTSTASSIISDALSGRVPADVQNLVRDKAAEQAVAAGMPGASAGTLFGNRELRDFGLTSIGQQQRGFQDLLSLLQGVSGTVAPTFGQAQEQENTRAIFAAAPDPAAAFAEQERLFDKYSTPAGGTVGSTSRPPVYVTWYSQGIRGKRLYDPETGTFGPFI